MNARAAKNGPGGKPKQFENLLADARTLDCNPTHLRRVLIGERPQCKTLLARYHALKGHPLNAAQRELVEKYNRRPSNTASNPIPDIRPSIASFEAVNRAGLEELSPEFFALTKGRGFTLVPVIFRWAVAVDGAGYPDYLGLFAELGEQLQAAQAGQYVEPPLYFGGKQCDLIDLPKEWRGHWADIGAVVVGRMVTFPGQIWALFHVATRRLATGLGVLQDALAPRAQKFPARIYVAETPRRFRQHWPSAGHIVDLDVLT